MNKKLKIMAVGDSITCGVKGNYSYRRYLVQSLDSILDSFEMVGSQENTDPPTCFKSAHEAFPGWKTSDFIDPQSGKLTFESSLLHYRPTTILLHIGSNDLLKGKSVQSICNNITHILDSIIEIDSSITIFVANVIPIYAKNGVERLLVRTLHRYISNIYSLGKQLAFELESIFDEQYKQSVYMVNVRKHFNKSMLTQDFVHPNVQGDIHISSAFFNKISEVHGLKSMVKYDSVIFHDNSM